MRHILLGCALLWGGLLNSYLLARMIAPRTFAPVAVLNNVADWLTLVSLLTFALALALRGSRGVRLWLAPGVIAFLVWTAPAWLPHRTPEVDGTPLTVATFNVLGHLADPGQTFAVISAMDADLVALQELRPTLQGKLRQELASTYPYQVSDVVQGYDGFALLSRYPIMEHEIIIELDWHAIDITEPRYLRAVLDVNGQRVVVFVIHPPVPTPNPYVEHLAEVLFHFDDSALHTHIVRTVELVRAETDPVLLLCDCNSTPRSRQYALIDSVLDEAFGAAGWGPGFTHPASPFPMLRIDYIWYSDVFTAARAKVWPDTGTSDHYPVWAELVLRASR